MTKIRALISNLNFETKFNFQDENANKLSWLKINLSKRAIYAYDEDSRVDLKSQFENIALPALWIEGSDADGGMLCVCVS